MSITAAILFSLIIIIFIGRKFITTRTHQAVEIHNFFLYTLIGAWLAVSSMEVYSHFENPVVTIIKKELQLPIPKTPQALTFT